MSLKLYVLIKSQMSQADQAVQAGHAVAQFGYDHPIEFNKWQETSNTLIYLEVGQIAYWKTILEDGNFKHSVFTETDWYGPYVPESGVETAIAVAPDWTCQYILFKDLPLAFQPKPKPKDNEDDLGRVPIEVPQRKRWWQ